ncbi:DNRLRE domain-containing protein [Clostridium omnivorum]|uniref:Fibronectin type-III domain-containing protein n=1 Tax=Clostridium omnivorum TaxID=1604902 RepID=A0ABQ5N8N3_9CLOT|nr:DNRLRE domain-containing protein [Clostridium sp. E14]GLC31550.1 hypothetical protein bsdE14_29600 [Clostridium sp. E14]
MKKRGHQRILASFLTLILITGLIPEKASSVEVANSGAVGISTEKLIVKELTEKRQENARFFLNSDGSETAVIYNTKVNYRSGDAYQRVSNNLIQPAAQYMESGFTYKNEANDFNVYFKDNIAKESPVQLEFGNYQVSLTPISANGSNVLLGTTYSSSQLTAQNTSISSIDEKNKQLPANINQYVNPVVKDSIEYKNVYGEGSSIQYQLINSGIKENIVLNAYNNTNKFEFNLNLKGLKLEKKENGPIILKDAVTGEIKGGMPLPFMVDSAENEHYSENIQTYIETKNEVEGRYKLIYIVDEEFLKSADTVYPVTIDPPIVIQGSSYNVTRDAYVESKYPGSNYWTSAQLRAGYDKTTGTARSYVKFPNLPSLGNATITGAWFAAVGTNENLDKGNNATIEVRKPNSNWDSSNITWNNAPSYGECIDSTAVSSPDWYYWNITSVVSDWYKGSVNYGLVLKDKNETWQYRRFSSSDGQYPPALIINYISPVTTLRSAAYGGAANSQNGYVNLTWNAVSGAKGYYVAIFNGLEYQYFDVGNVTSWTTKGQGIWPEAGEIAKGRYQLHKDKLGVELPNDPVNCYRVSPGDAVYKSQHFYYFRVMPYNDGGYANIDSCNCEKVYIPDTSSPEGIQTTSIKVNNNPAINETNAWQLKLTWTIPKDLPEGKKEDGTSLASGIQKYKVRLIQVNSNSVVKEAEVTSGTTEYLFNNVADNYEYKAEIYAYDNNGNYTISAKAAGPVITGDRTPPTVPSNVSISRSSGKLGDIPSITWAGIKDEKGLSSVQYKINNNGWVDIGKNTEGGSVDINCSYLQEGNNIIYVRGIDKQGNIGESKAVYYKLDTKLPSINITSPKDMQIINGQIGINGEIYDENIKEWKIEYGYGRTPSSFTTVSAGTANSPELNYILDVSGYLTGLYTIRITAKDIANNASVKQVTVDKSNKIALESTLNITQPIKGQTLNNIMTPVKYAFLNGSSIDGLKGKLYINSMLYKEQSASTDILQINALDFKEGSENNIYVDAFNSDGKKFSSESSYYIKSTKGLKDILWTKQDNIVLSPAITLEYVDDTSNNGFLEGQVEFENEVQAITLNDDVYRYGSTTTSVSSSGDPTGEPVDSQINYKISCDNGITWKSIWPNNKAFLDKPNKKIKIRVSLTMAEIPSKYTTALLQNKLSIYKFVPKIFDINITGLFDCILDDNFSNMNKINSSTINSVSISSEGIKLINPQSTTSNSSLSTKVVGSVQAKKIELMESVSKVRVEAQEIRGSGEIFYYISSDEGVSWQKINLNEDTNLNKASNKLILKAELSAPTGAVSPTIKSWRLIELDCKRLTTSNTFKVQLLDIPQNLEATPKVNYTTLLRWQYDLLKIQQGVRFNVYRSTIQGFTPSKENLIASNITTTYYNDYNINYGQKFYYKVTAVKDFEGQKGRESCSSNSALATIVDKNELDKRLGLEDYWAASQFRTGAGSGFINLTSGNLCYEGTDFVYPSPKLAMVLRRTYNNQATSKSSFGIGWDFNFNTNLLKEYDVTGKIVQALILKDGDGTTHRFKIRADGTYESPKGSHMELTQKTNGTYEIRREDNITYVFDSSMNLKLFKDDFGNALNITYNGRGNIDSVYDNYNHKISFFYENKNIDLVSSIVDPSGRVFHYEYNSNEKLEKMYIIIENNQVYSETYLYDKNNNIEKVIGPKNQQTTSFQYYDNGTVKRFTDPKSEYIDIQYAPQVNAAIFTEGETTLVSNRNVKASFKYNVEGNLIETVDPLLNHTYYEVDSDYNTRAMKYYKKTDDKSEEIKYSYDYDSKGNIISITDPELNLTEFKDYNKFNEPKKIIKKGIEDGKEVIIETNYNYDDNNGNLLTSTDSENRVTTYDYYSNGLIKSSTDNFNNKTEYIYYEEGAYKGKLRKTIEPLGKVTEVTEYDKQGNATKIITYDANNPSKIEDSIGALYDILGRKTRTIYQDNQYDEYEYDLNHNLVASYDRDKVPTIYGYDDLDRPTYVQKVNGDCSSTSYEYNADNKLVVTTEDAGARTTQQYYDAAGRVEKTISGNNYTRYEYDNLGNMTKIFGRDDYDEKKEKLIATAQYDVFNRITKQFIDPTNKNICSSVDYDFLGNKKSEIDGLGNKTEYNYDNIGRLKAVHNFVTSRTYDESSKKITETQGKIDDLVTDYLYDQRDPVEVGLVYNSVKDALHRETRTYFDALGRKVKETKKDGETGELRETKYDYYITGKLKTEIKPDKTPISFEYTNLLQLKTVKYGADNSQYTSFDYYNNGLTKSIEDLMNGNSIKTDYQYDSIGRLEQITQEGQYIGYHYDGSNNVTDISYACGGENKNIHYQYDKSNRLDYIASGENTVREYKYTFADRVDNIINYRKFDTGNKDSYTLQKYKYNSLGQPEEIQYLENGNSLKEKYNLQFDNNGRIKNEVSWSNYTNADYTKTDYENKDSNKQIEISKTESYLYDELGRLITDTSTKTETGKETKNKVTNYSYDWVGNRKAKVSDTETLAYNYNDFNNLLNIYRNGNIKSKWTYDLNGNQLTETTNREKDEVPGKDAAQVTKEFIYDRSDRLYKLKTTDGTNLQEVTNYYNANGERTKQIEVNKKVTDTNTSVPGLETRYFYNNGKLLFTTDQNHTLVEDNLLDPSGQIIFTKRNDGNYTNKYFFYSHDTRGSVSNIINPDGKLVKGYSYDEFGGTEERGDKSFKNSVKFTGAVNDSSTGLYYMNARFYNPSTARFLTQDSYTGNPYEPRTQHLYSYCANDPINYTDPTGHMMRSDAEDGGSTPDPLQTYLNNRVKLGGSSVLSPATRKAWNGLNDTFKYEGVISNFAKNIDKGISKASDAANNNIIFAIVPLLRGNTQALERDTELFESKIPRIEGIIQRSSKTCNLPVLHSDQIIMNNYQRYYNEAWSQVVNDFNKGKITIPADMNWKTVLGQRTDSIARNRLINFLGREGIPEGPQTDVLVNRWLRDPSGSGKYRIPDLRLKATGNILDGTIGNKTMTSPQIQDFIKFSGGDKVIIIRP